MIAGKRLLFFSFLFFWSLSASAQKSKSQLQKEKQKNLEKIKETEKILSETAQQKKNSLGELNALNRRIEQQEGLIVSIKGEITLLNQDIGEKNEIIGSLERDVEKLKEEYATMLFAAQKASGKVDRLTFLFSAQSFDQLIMRLKYMEQYGKARKDQAQAIAKVQSILSEQVRITESKRQEKTVLLKEEEKENDQLGNLKQKQRTLVRSLEKEEKKLKRDLEATRRAVAELDDMITKIIKEEIERAAREAREREQKEKNKKNNNEPVGAAPEIVALSNSFEENKKKLPWPVQGFVSQKFGKQPHPVLKGIVIQNLGINIQTNQNEPVKAIFEGEVRAVMVNPLLGSSVLIKHGEYFSLYTGLKDVSVRSGQRVERGHELGKVITNSDGVAELRLRINKNFEDLNPEAWLRN